MACLALDRLCFQNQTNQSEMDRCGGVPLIMKAVRMHKSDKESMLMVYGVMVSFSANPENRASISQQGVIGFIIEELRTDTGLLAALYCATLLRTVLLMVPR